MGLELSFPPPSLGILPLPLDPNLGKVQIEISPPGSLRPQHVNENESLWVTRRRTLIAGL